MEQLLVGLPLALVIGVGTGIIPGAAMGLIFGTTRLERFAPATAAVAGVALGMWTVFDLFNVWPTRTGEIALVAVAPLACGVVGVLTGSWVQRQLAGPITWPPNPASAEVWSR